VRFEISERIRTTRTADELLVSLEEQFGRIADSVQRSGAVLTAKAIEASFGSVNRNDDTTITVRPMDGGVLLVAEVNYRPSVMFWILLILLLFTTVLWLIPIAFYLHQKNTVRDAIAACFQRVRNEFDEATASASGKSSAGSHQLDQLSKLADLHQRGVLSDAEFAEQKRRLLEM